MKITDNLHAFFFSSLSVNNCNTYLVLGPPNVLIDPGHSRYADHVEKGLDELGISWQDIELVICTHSHPDHIEDAARWKDKGVPMALHKDDWELARAPDNFMMSAYGISPAGLEPDFFLQEGTLFVRSLRMEVLHTPGHSPGSISLYWPREKALFTGDLVFQDGIGRTDIPGGDGKTLKQSIRRLRSLDIAYMLPGHGGVVVGEKEVTANFARIEQVWFAMM